MVNKLNSLYLKAQFAVKDFMEEEEGSFIEAVALLGIGVLVMAVFIGYKDQILDKVAEIMDQFDIH